MYDDDTDLDVDVAAVTSVASDELLLAGLLIDDAGLGLDGRGFLVSFCCASSMTQFGDIMSTSDEASVLPFFE